VYRRPIAFHKRLAQGEIPTPYVLISTAMGYRAYAERELPGIFEYGGLIADGSVTADGSEVAGSDGIGVLEKSARVVSFDSFDRDLQSEREDILTSYTSKQIQAATVELDNADKHFSKLLPKEPFLGRWMKIYVGFPDMPQADHIPLFHGIIKELTVMETLTIEAEEA